MKHFKYYNNSTERIDDLINDGIDIPLNEYFVHFANKNEQVFFNEIESNDRNYKELEYQQLEYIENTSTASIDTGLTTNVFGNFKYELEISYNEIDSQIRQLNGSNGQHFFGINTEGYFECAGQTSTVLTETNRYHIQTYEGQRSGSNVNITFSVDNEQIIIYTTAINQVGHPICIFNIGQNVSTIAEYNIKAKIKSFKIWFDNKLVRNFVPVKSTNNGKVGMFDKVEYRFYTSTNNVEFIGGQEIQKYYEQQMFTETYVEVEYIANSSTSYINTEIFGFNTLRIEAILKANKRLAQMQLFGLYGSKMSIELYTNGQSNGSTLFAYSAQDTSDGGDWISTGFWSTEKLKFILDVTYTKGNDENSRGLTIYKDDGSLAKYTAPRFAINNPNNAHSDTYPVLICTCDPNGSASGGVGKGRWAPINIYSFKMIDTKTNTLLRDFVPVLRIRDGRYGLFDKVNSKFYDSRTGIPFAGSTNFVKDEQGNYIIHKEKNKWTI